MRNRWQEGLYLALLLLFLGAYLSRPARRGQWALAARWWQSLWHYRGLEESGPRFADELLLRPPADYQGAELGTLATFDAVAYLGCDTAVTQSSTGEVHLWLITYWRYPAGKAYRVEYALGPPGEARSFARHDLPAAGGEGHWVTDRVLLPEEAVRGEAVSVRLFGEGGRPLAAASPLLEVAHARVVIWQR